MKINKISSNVYEIPKKGKMKVPARVFASEKLFKKIKEDETLKQIENVSSLPGILVAGMVMPDGHQGFGFPVGGVAAFDPEKGVIAPGGVGYDINCSVRLLKTNLQAKDLENLKDISKELYRNIPVGVGDGRILKVSSGELDEVLKKGVQWCVEKGYGKKQDYLHMEESGKIQNANPSDVGQKAKSRGLKQFGSLGAGNHFVEIQKVEEIFDEKTARVFGLKKNQIVIMVHCGSRGLGHQVASDYMKKIEKIEHTKISENLVYAPIQSEIGKKYLSAMACAANFAFANKQLITEQVRKVFKKFYSKVKIDVVYDVCHNIAKFEEHFIDGKKKEVLIVRKGATRSFGPGRKEIPKVYQKMGQPVLVPGSMGTSSYVLVGTEKAEKVSFGSCSHGAGRAESRSQAKQSRTSEEVQRELREKGIQFNVRNLRGLAEEAPEAYKDINEVIEVISKEGLGKKVARLIPLAVIKG